MIDRDGSRKCVRLLGFVENVSGVRQIQSVCEIGKASDDRSKNASVIQILNDLSALLVVTTYAIQV